jgi:hypothetical protein
MAIVELGASLRRSGALPVPHRTASGFAAATYAVLTDIEASVGASERAEFLRAAWRALVIGKISAERLVFVDEMGSNTSLAPLYAWAPKGKRACCSTPATAARRRRSWEV